MSAPIDSAGVVTTACVEEERCATREAPTVVGESHQLVTREGQTGRFGVADRRVVPMKPGNAGGGKGPDFGHAVEGNKGRRVAQAYSLQVNKTRRFQKALDAQAKS